MAGDGMTADRLAPDRARIPGSAPVSRSSDPRTGQAGRSGRHAVPAVLVLLCCLVGVPVSIEIRMIGALTLTELMMIFLVPILTIAYGFPRLSWPVGQLVALALLWLVMQGVSDLMNDTSFDNLARGAARAGITAFLIVGFLVLLRGRMRLVGIVFASFSVGFVLGPILGRSDYYLHDAWKFGYGTGTTMVLVLLSMGLWMRGFRMVAILVCLGAGGLNLLLGFRSMAGIALMSGVLLSLSVFAARTMHVPSALRLGFALPVLLLGAFAIVEIYAFAAGEGYLGETAQARFEIQVDDRGVLLSGRTEYVSSIPAVMDRPFLGHGSWAENRTYALLLWESLGGTADTYPETWSDLIPTHSHIMGAWVEGGLLSALFWMYVLVLIWRCTFLLVREPSLNNPILAFIVINLGWAVLFSPYSQSNRVMACLSVVVIAGVLQSRTTSRTAAVGPSPRIVAGRSSMPLTVGGR